MELFLTRTSSIEVKDHQRLMSAQNYHVCNNLRPLFFEILDNSKVVHGSNMIKPQPSPLVI